MLLPLNSCQMLVLMLSSEGNTSCKALLIDGCLKENFEVSFDYSRDRLQPVFKFEQNW